MIALNGREARAVEEAWAVAVAAGDPVAVLTEYARGVQCSVTTVPLTTALNGPCGGADGAVPAKFCGPGVVALDPLWIRTRPSEAGPWTAWSHVASGACPQDVLPALTVADFRRLPLPPTPTTVQPGTGYVLVGYGIIVTADPAPVDLTTTLLGYPVTVHATPTRYVWDFGDHTTLDTTDPGLPYPTDGSTPPAGPDSPYPAGSHGHPYTAPGTYTLTLTTTWTGTYQIAGDPTTRPITGTATTTTTHPPLTVVERRTHLVADTCLTNPHGPGC
ncbi:MAG TPA: hypothetical protein VFW79_04805 [Cellulomonas sp.]|uniref:hypothetical protein n=1 Tax=Cellulomonas sp. TaxID=40001 RepID=UPI002E314C54|nr:hypothetical protein [Cellulomonas sp.]HEX5331944.1 hypothetical protein [Cellulomonas sp.]